MALREVSRQIWAGILLFLAFLLVMTGAELAGTRATFMGIGLDFTALSIENRLAAVPGILSTVQRRYRDGSVERRFNLRDGAFVRATFSGGNDSEKPEILSFDVAGTPSSADAIRLLRRQLGHPAWEQRIGGGSTLRQIWGGVGQSEDAIIRRSTATGVVEIVISDDHHATLTIARPSWFQAKEKQ